MTRSSYRYRAPLFVLTFAAVACASSALGGCGLIYGVGNLDDVGAVAAGDADAGSDAAAPPPDAAACVSDACACDGGACAADPIAALTAGMDHACALTERGLVRCWGANDRGQLGHDPARDVACALGDAGTPCSATPVVVEEAAGRPLVGVKAITAGHKFTCARLADDTVACWGANDGEQLGHLNDNDPKCDGGPCNARPIRVAGLAKVTSLSAGSFRATVCAVSEGAVLCWGRQASGALGDGDTAPNVLNDLSLGVHEPQRAAIPVPVVDVTVGGQGFACARAADRATWCWGRNVWNVLRHAGSGTGDPPDVDGSGGYKCNPTPQRADNLAPDLITLGDGHGCEVTGGATSCWGYNGYEAASRDLGALGVTVEVSGTWQHTCSRSAQGDIWCWGADGFGQCGQGTVGVNDAGVQPCAFGVPCRAAPKRVDGMPARATLLATGGDTTYVKLSDGSVWGFGDGSLGQLGAAGLPAYGDAGRTPCGMDNGHTCRATPVRILEAPSRRVD